jgi:hypothetical protein
MIAAVDGVIFLFAGESTTRLDRDAPSCGGSQRGKPYTKRSRHPLRSVKAQAHSAQNIERIPNR